MIMELYTADKKEQVGRCYLCEDNIPRNSIQFESPVASSSAKDEIVTTIHLPSVANESLSKPEAKCSSLSVDIESNSDSQIPKFRHSPNIEDYSTISTINEISYSTGFGEMSDCGNAENNYLMENINNIVIQQDSINGDTLIVCDLAADSQETHGSSLKEPDATDSFVHKISVKNYSLNLRYGNVFYDIEQSKGEIFYIKNENLFNSSGDSNEFPTTLPREAPPPTYRSLIEQILEDSPPSYEDVTGNKVIINDLSSPPTIQRSTGRNARGRNTRTCKPLSPMMKKIFITKFFVFIILLTILWFIFGSSA